MCLVCTSLALARTGVAADAPEQPVIATVQGTDILAKDVHPARARILAAFKTIRRSPSTGQ